jgi:hypothetical protein
MLGPLTPSGIEMQSLLNLLSETGPSRSILVTVAPLLVSLPSK